MTVIRINAITVPGDAGPELERRFAARKGDVDQHDGFEGFELLRPTDGADRWFVVTRWRDEAAFEAWRGSQSFSAGHAQAQAGSDGAPARPVASGAELLSFEVVDLSGAPGS
jgi:heme-degrading monooxygenase HmoA